jgi:hypothetical protein
MLSRALSLATVTLVIGCLTAVAVRAVENLEAGKSPSQIFAGTCNACHKSPRGLLKTVPASSLPGFLRQHYTTSSDMASVLASFLVSNGAADPRFQAKEAKQGKDGAKEGAKDARQEAATRPEPTDANRNAKQRLPRPYEPEATRPDHVPAQAAIDAKQGTKQKQGKKGRPAEEPPKVEEPAKTEPAEAPKTETAKGDDSAKPEGKSETGKTETGKSETAKVDAPKEAVSEPPSSRPDPVPPVTPAPAATAAAPASTAASSTPSEAPAGSSAPPAQAARPTAPAVAAAPSLPPVSPAGPPAPPISQ